jgi:hypothetical protein
MRSLAARGAPEPAGHRCVDRRLVNENEAALT